MGSQTGYEDSRPVVHAKGNLLETFAAALVLRTNREPVGSIRERAGVEGDIRGQFLVDNRLWMAVQIEANTRFVQGYAPLP